MGSTSLDRPFSNACSFFYKKMSTAPNLLRRTPMRPYQPVPFTPPKHIVMKIPAIIAVAVQYDALLTRYARFITKDHAVAAGIVMHVIEAYYDGKTELCGTDLRSYLHKNTRSLCGPWLYKNSLRTTSSSNIIS
jgi:hypothetical protein